MKRIVHNLNMLIEMIVLIMHFKKYHSKNIRTLFIYDKRYITIDLKLFIYHIKSNIK